MADDAPLWSAELRAAAKRIVEADPPTRAYRCPGVPFRRSPSPNLALSLGGAGGGYYDDDGCWWRAGTARLLVACRNGHADVARLLIEEGADVGQAMNDGATPLLMACLNGHDDVARLLIEKDADVGQAKNDGASPLLIAGQNGHLDVARLLLENGAEVGQAKNDGVSPLFIASLNGHLDVARLLLHEGADVGQAVNDGASPLIIASHNGHLPCVQLLSSYGAPRTSEAFEAEEVATRRGHDDTVAWLILSRQWSTPLHHLAIIDAARARALIRVGADLHAAAAAGGPTPLSLARAAAVLDGSPADLVLRAARPWSRETHALRCPAARSRAVKVMLLGCLVSRLPRFEGDGGVILRVWVERVMPHLDMAQR